MACSYAVAGGRQHAKREARARGARARDRSAGGNPPCGRWRPRGRPNEPRMASHAATPRARAWMGGRRVLRARPSGRCAWDLPGRCIWGSPNDPLCDTAPRSAAHEAGHTDTGTGPRACPCVDEIPASWKRLGHPPRHAIREAALRPIGGEGRAWRQQGPEKSHHGPADPWRWWIRLPSNIYVNTSSSQWYGLDQIENFQRFLIACKRMTWLIARPRRYSRAGPPTLSVRTIVAVLVLCKPTPPPAKAPSASRSGSVRIEASVGPRGACRGRVLTARRAAHSSQGPWPRAAALRCRVRHLSLVRQVSSRSEIFLRRASRATSSCQFEALYFRRMNLTFGMFTQITKVCTDDWKVATRSCRERSLFVPPSLTLWLLGYIADLRILS